MASMYTLRSIFRFGQRPLTRSMGALLTVAAVLLAPLSGAQAQTQAHSAIQALLQSGQAEQALLQATQALAATPRDPQLQFLKSNAELALGQTEAADASLSNLTQNYPELAEPWNNLAKLRAAQGRLEEAQQLLEKALLNNPQYEQAHANLAQVLITQALTHLEQANALAVNAQRTEQIQALRAALGHSAP